jgi:hypothetical protein
MKIVDRLGKLGAVDDHHAVAREEVLKEVRVSAGDARRRFDEVEPDSNLSPDDRVHPGRRIIAEEFTDFLIDKGNVIQTDDGRLYLGKPLRIDGKSYRPGQDVALDVLQRGEAAAQRRLDAGLEDLWAPMGDDQYRALVEGMRTHGYLKALPIMIDEDGRILDGFHRQRAALEAGVEPETKVVPGSPLQKLMAVVMANANRRHDPKAVKTLVADLARDGVKWEQVTNSVGTMFDTKELKELRREYTQIRRKQGATVREIAEETGASPATAWRDAEPVSQSEESETNDHEKLSRKPSFDMEAALRYHFDEGMTPKDAAREAGWEGNDYSGPNSLRKAIDKEKVRRAEEAALLARGALEPKRSEPEPVALAEHAHRWVCADCGAPHP